MKAMGKYVVVILGLLLALAPSTTEAQKKRKTKSTGIDSALYSSLEYREIGPFRGGRSAAVTGVPGQPKLFYMGSTGGGVWRTADGGQTYENISDGYFGGSIGSVAVATSDPNVSCVGGGEVTVRGNVSSGYGFWNTTDAGQTWQYVAIPT